MEEEEEELPSHVLAMESWFDALPDSVACAILSKLGSAQDVAQCAGVSRRWRALCSSVDALDFASFKLFEKRINRASKASCLEAIVSQMLLRSNGVRELSISYHPVVWPWIPDDHFTEEEVCSWLLHVQGSLARLVLVDPNRDKPQPRKLLQLSLCTRLTWLNLCYGMIPDIPPTFKRMESLKTCILDLISINDAALETLVQLCPRLEDLKLNSCKGLRSPTLSAPNLVSLEFVYEMDVCNSSIACLTVEAPKLSKMSLSYVEELITDGESLLELGLLCHVRPRIRDLSQLTVLQLKGQVWQLESLLELIRLGVNLTQLQVDSVIGNKRPVQLEDVFHHLPSLRLMYIGADMFECMQAGADGRSAGGAPSIWLPRLEEVTTVVCTGNRGCIQVLAALLRCSSSLRSLRIDAHRLSKGAGNISFFTDVLSLQREFPQVRISLDCPYSLQ